MAYARRLDFMFCNMCGTMLSLISPKYAGCPLCKSKRSAKEIAGREISYTVTAEDIRRDLSIEPFVNPDGVYLTKENTQGEAGQRTLKKCPLCEKESYCEFTERQMRSADEGATITYRCGECGESFKD